MATTITAKVMESYFNELNGLRGWAFLNVVVEHYSIIYYGFLIPTGAFGVDLFYVLSSFLLTFQLYKRKEETDNMNVLNYFVKRLFRIYPCLTIALIFEYYFQTFSLTLSQIISIFLLYGNYKIYWTIYVEMRSYIFLPLVVLLFHKIRSVKLKILVSVMK